MSPMYPKAGLFISSRGLVALLAALLFVAGATLSVYSEEIAYKYDSLNRLIEVHYPDKTIYYTYDAAGNRTSVRVETLALPTISGLSPDNAVAGSGGFILTVNGANFVDGAMVTFNGNNRSTTFNSSAQLTAQIMADDISAAGSYPVSVVNPTGSPSTAANFTVTPIPVLRIDSVTPRAGRASGGQQIKLSGAFAGLSTVKMGSVSASWSYTNGTSEVTLTTPQHSVGAVTIELVPSSGSAYSRTNAFAYLPTVFTDDTLVVGVTEAKAQHIIELRQAVDALRAVAGLTNASWTDASLVPTVTTIRAIHIAELRTYLNEAATALGYQANAFTDPSLTNGFSIKRIYIEELRQRVRLIAN
jgi:YD repeat-containing protein